MANLPDKNILFLINKLGVGGAEGVFIKDANSLNSLNFCVYFAVLYGNRSDQTLIGNLELERNNIFINNGKSLFDIRAFFRLLFFVYKQNIDVVYSTLDESNIISRLLKIFKPSLKVIIREANIADPKPKWFKILDIFLNIFVNKIICVSEEVLESLLSYQKLFKYKMVVLMNGVFIPERYKVYTNQIVLPLKIINVGSLTPKKGQIFLLQACLDVLVKKPGSISLSIYGSGQEKQNLINFIKTNNIEKSVNLYDAVSFDKLSEAYLESDIFVLSSIREGCPNVLLEAMAHGLASIATNVSGVTSIISNSNFGTVVEKSDPKMLAQAIMSCLEKPEMLMSQGIASRQRMKENFSTDVRIKKLLSYI